MERVEFLSQKIKGVFVVLAPLIRFEPGVAGLDDAFYQTFLFAFGQEAQTGVVNAGVLVGNVTTIELDALCSINTSQVRFRRSR